jgi:two-component system response regulator AdeR
VILVVEDEVELARLYTDWLDDEYEVRMATSGEEGLKQYDDDVDVVLLDRRMPGLSGDEVLAEIRDRPGSCQVAMVTAVDPDVDILELGFDDYVTKPVSSEDLLRTVERLLTRATYEESVQEYFALASKRATVEAEKSATELSENEEYLALATRIDELESEIDRRAESFEEVDFRAAFHGIGEDEDSEDSDEE